MITQDYIKRLHGMFYKVLCLFEENSETITINIDSLLYELDGLQCLLNKKDISILISVISILERMYDDSLQAEYDLAVIKREVFHCMDLISKLRTVGDE